MKSNFFKIVLPAFALMIAITASLAFTSNSSDADVIVYIEPGCQKVFIDESQVPSTCETINTGAPCTIIFLGQTYDAYESKPCLGSDLLRNPS